MQLFESYLFWPTVYAKLEQTCSFYMAQHMNNIITYVSRHHCMKRIIQDCTTKNYKSAIIWLMQLIESFLYYLCQIRTDLQLLNSTTHE